MIGSSADGMTWQPVARLIDIDAPVECPAGTAQHDMCEALAWELLCRDLGLPPCAPEPVVDAGEIRPPEVCEGCCCSHASMAGLLLLPIVPGRLRSTRAGARRSGSAPTP
jgi:hypothetical protein